MHPYFFAGLALALYGLVCTKQDMDDAETIYPADFPRPTPLSERPVAFVRLTPDEFEELLAAQREGVTK